MDRTEGTTLSSILRNSTNPPNISANKLKSPHLETDHNKAAVHTIGVEVSCNQLGNKETLLLSSSKVNGTHMYTREEKKTTTISVHSMFICVFSLH